MGLQLLMAFPEDRLPTMAAHADTIIQCRVERTRDARDVVSGIENRVIRVDCDRLQEVMASHEMSDCHAFLRAMQSTGRKGAWEQENRGAVLPP
jgi:hypothetical protein